MKKKIAVVFGGASSEHDVSCVSARSVILNIPKETYELYLLGITRQGQWLLYEGDPDRLPEDGWLESGPCTPAIISPDATVHGMLVFRGSGTEEIKLDAIFPVLHGKNGEDGTIQGLFQLAQIPYVGCNATVSGVCMDKAITNAVADQAGIPHTSWLSTTQYAYGQNPELFESNAIAKLGFPIFVKPANAGSSVGITKAVDAESLKTGIQTAFQEDRKIVLEAMVDGYEVECAVLGTNSDPKGSTVGQIVPPDGFYDYEAKYVNNSTELLIPAKLPEEKLKEVKQAAEDAFAALGCEGMARMDFFVRKSDGKVMLNEPNTLPGFTSISMYPKLWEDAGVPYPELLDRLLELAIERGGVQ